MVSFELCFLLLYDNVTVLLRPAYSISNRLAGVCFLLQYPYDLGFPGGSDGKESACNVGDLDSIPGLEDPLEKGMATYYSILAWRIPWTEEPGRLQSTELQRLRHA